MLRSSFMSMLLVFVVCQFCEKDFVSIGRHSWRCKQRIHQGNDGVVNESLVQQAPLTNSPEGNNSYAISLEMLLRKGL